MMPFLTIVTRCYKRPEALKINITSVTSQKSEDWEQVFIVDDVGRGYLWANESLYHNRHRVKGDYVFILDDDDHLTYDGFVDDLKSIVKRHNPAIIMVKATTPHIHKILPTDLVWKKHPIVRHIGTGNFVVRNDIWQKYIKLFGRPKAGDFAFISAIFADAESNDWGIYWFDKVCMNALKVSWGRPE